MPLSPETDPDFFQRVVDQLDEALFVVDKQRSIVFFNRAAERLTGRSREQVLGRSCNEGLRCSVCGPACAALEGRESGEQLFELPTASGGRVLVRRKAVPLRSNAGEIVGVVEVLQEQEAEIPGRLSRPSRPWDPEDAAPLRAIVGRSREIRHIVDTIRRLARSDASVLVTGESGTGKEVVARAIHGVSRRRDRAFVAINCAALPAELIESELFGHVRGAFTGAIRDRIGAVQAAEGGTFFLDEIGDLDPHLQAKLLRLLQERTYQRIGDSQTSTANIRVIAATNVDIDQAVLEGRFREDLYYRLRVVPIHIPALRDRREDIEPLAKYQLARRSVAAGRRPMRFTPNALRVIENHAWPGNVRELVNAVDYVIALASEELVTDHDLPEDVQRPRIAPVFKSQRGRYAAAQSEAEERTRILAALQSNQFHRQNTATALGMDRVTLYRKMKDLGIAAED